MTSRTVLLCHGVLLAGLCSVTTAAARSVTLEASSATVGKYERIEFVISVDRRYPSPFDPDQVDLTLLISAPDGSELHVPAFFGQPYERRQFPGRRKTADWVYPVGRPVWMARFAPSQVGTYSAVARLKDGDGIARSGAVRFRSTPSRRKGFLRVSKTDPRFLAFDRGEPFFAIGQNLAFVGEGQPVNLSKAEAIFAKLSQNGANFLRVWACCQDWAMAIEARKSAWGRSWSGKPSLAPMPDGDGPPQRQCVQIAGADGTALSVSPSHTVAVRPNTRYAICGRVKTDGQAKLRIELSGTPARESYASGPERDWTTFRREFTTGSDQWWLGRIGLRLDGAGTVLLDGLSLREADGGPELLWEADVNRPPRGYYNQVDCFMLDQLVEAAEQNGIYLQLCLITRDLYMESLKDPKSPEYDRAIADARNLLRYAVARWGYSTHVAAWEYFNEIDPGRPTDRFYAELGEYLEQIDVYGHLRTTSTWHPSPKDWRHPELDMAQLHHYLRPVPDAEWQDGVKVIAERTKFLKEETPRGPVLIGEFGLADTRFGRSSYMQQDRQLVHFHNALWASALSGASGTALFWWWEQLEVQDCYHHYRPLAKFLADVPFTTAGLKETSASISAENVRVLGLQGKDCAYLWLFNPQATWGNLVVQKSTPAEIKSATLKIPDLTPGRYRVTWWDTHRGEVLQQQEVSATQQPLQLPVPPFSRDVACKITSL